MTMGTRQGSHAKTQGWAGGYCGTPKWELETLMCAKILFAAHVTVKCNKTDLHRPTRCLMEVSKPRAQINNLSLDKVHLINFALQHISG